MLLYDAAPLLRRHLPPLLTQLRAAFGRHLPEPVEGFAQPLLPLGRQAVELLPALPHRLTLFRLHGTPLLEALLRATALLGGHGEPTIAAARQ